MQPIIHDTYIKGGTSIPHAFEATCRDIGPFFDDVGALRFRRPRPDRSRMSPKVGVPHGLVSARSAGMGRL